MSNQGHGGKMTVVLINSVSDMKFYFLNESAYIHCVPVFIYIQSVCKSTFCNIITYCRMKFIPGDYSVALSFDY